MGIEEQIDRLIDLGEDIKSRLDLLVELASDHFADADKMVADEPAKEPEREHPAGPKPDPGEGYRILSKEPLEDLTPGDEFEDVNGEWIRSSNAETDKKQGATCWYRRKIEVAKEPVDHLAVARISPGEWLDIRDAYRDATPADVGRLVYVRNGELEPWIELRLAEVTGADFPYRCTKDGLDPTMWQAFRYAVIRNERPASKAEPSWEPKVGDWVRVTRPKDWEVCRFPYWSPKLHRYNRQVGQIEFDCGDCFKIRGFVESDGFQYQFHRDWLTPAEPLKDEYRQPVLPADAGEQCEFSRDGKEWCKFLLAGWQVDNNPWICERYHCWPYARIKKDA